MDQQEGPVSEVQPEEDVQSAANSSRVEFKRAREKGKRRSLHPSKRGYKCSSYGCTRTFLKMQELITHVSVHYKPTESLKDKLFLCSVSGCGEAVDSMQELMNHLKVHYKPNRYFKCENCMQHFRTHRSLFKHLHVCVDSNSNAVALSAQPPPPLADPKATGTEEPAQKHQSVIRCLKKVVPVSPTDDPITQSRTPSSSSLPDDIRQSMSSLVSQSSNPFSLLDPSLLASRFPSPASVVGSYLPFLHPSAYTTQGSIPQRLRPFLGNQVLPASNAIWKKNQGHSTNSRILWEHTRDSYNCMQCTFSTESRNQMTKHIEEQHKSPQNRLQGEIEYDLEALPFSPKAAAEMESSLITQL
ncbi:zinc finger 414 isoform X2 [Pelobates cultripes]|uniref:Zinc finger 414 isoform X2 n=1 Tax=Pelobates cultripes TaxID=61616 RepID=A0AAD1W7Q0_PELCU|nr:zinc finger 414 isoform X2 [Pelobates cultripes]